MPLRLWNTAAAVMLSVCAVFADSLPVPTGTYGVGYTDHLWVDSSRTMREVVVRIWYPADGAAVPGAPWLERFEQAKVVVGESALRKAFGAAYSSVADGSLKTHSRQGVAIARRPGRFPVIVFSHGLGTPGLAYTIQLEELASHGYVVASVTRPSDSSLTVFPDGRVTTMASAGPPPAVDEKEHLGAWVRDIHFVLQRLLAEENRAPWSKRIHAQSVGVLGHSFGGRAAAEACLGDDRIKACVDQDGMLPGGLPFTPKENGHALKAPFLLMTTSASVRMPTAGELARMNQTQLQFEKMLTRLRETRSRVFAGIRGGSHRLVLDVPGISHQSFSDLPFLAAPSAQDRRNAERALDVVRACTVAFFDHHLKGLPMSLQQRAATFSEVQAEHWPSMVQ